MFSHKYRLAFILLLGIYSYINTLLTDVYVYYPIRASWWYVLIAFLIICFLIWESNRFIEQFIQSKTIKVFAKKVPSLLLQFFLTTPFTLVGTSFTCWLVGTVFLKYDMKALELPLKLAIAFGFRINLFLNGVNSILYFVAQAKERQREAEQLKRISTQAQLHSLKMQINPHFLFNSLNVLSTLILKDKNLANEFIEQFSKVYRYVLKNYDKEVVELSAEIEFIETYTYLLKKRFGENVQVILQIHPRYLSSYYTIPVALQMLVENAIKHNIVSQKRPLTIRISTHDPDFLWIENNLQRKVIAEKDSTQIGLKNIAKRYELLNQHSVEIQETKESFIVKLPLFKISEI